MASARAQAHVFAGAAAETEKDSGNERDVEIAASMSATELRHAVRPRVRSRVEGASRAETLDETVRQNVAEQVEAGRTYEHVGIQRNLGARLRVEPQNRGERSGA